MTFFAVLPDHWVVTFFAVLPDHWVVTFFAVLPDHWVVTFASWDVTRPRDWVGKGGGANMKCEGCGGVGKGGGQT